MGQALRQVSTCNIEKLQVPDPSISNVLLQKLRMLVRCIAGLSCTCYRSIFYLVLVQHLSCLSFFKCYRSTTPGNEEAKMTAVAIP